MKDLTPQQKLFYRIWSERSGVSLAQILRCIIGGAIMREGGITFEEFESQIPEWKRIQDTQPDWYNIPEGDEVDLDVLDLINEISKDESDST